jgi:hypothetical protein
MTPQGNFMIAGIADPLGLDVSTVLILFFIDLIVVRGGLHQSISDS